MNEALAGECGQKCSNPAPLRVVGAVAALPAGA
jgi:hypothetical protein